MKIINQSVELLAASGVEGTPFSYYVDPMRLIEYAARTCYGSQDKMLGGVEGEQFCEKLWAKGHRSIWEHSWQHDHIFQASANIRAWREHNGTFEHVYKRKTKAASFHIITNRAIQNELVRHRLASFSVRSTRYCREDKGEMEFVRPPWEMKDSTWEKAMYDAEGYYQVLVEDGWKAEQARGVLPLDLKCELVMSAPIPIWEGIMAQRTAKDCHPQMREVAGKIKEILVEKGCCHE